MDALNRERIAAGLTAAVPVYTFDTVDSTSSFCRRQLAAGETACLAAAEHQSAGRGRQGRDFFSPADRGLYFSLLFSPAGGIASADGFTAYAAVAVRRAIRDACGVSCGIKWVNDLYLGGRKVCGILTEAVGDALIAGIGINLRSGALPEPLRDIAGALDADCDRNALCAAIAGALLAWQPGETAYLDEYRSASIVLGREVAYVQGGREHRGVARDIAPDGALVVETGAGLVSLGSGEIRLVRDSLFPG